HCRIARRRSVEPAAPTRPARCGAVLIAACAQMLADGVQGFCRERAAADPSRISLRDLDDAIDIFRRNTKSGRNTSGSSTRRSDEWKCTVVHVEQRSLSSFEQNGFSAANHPIQHDGCIDHEWPDLLAVLCIGFADRSRIDRLWIFQCLKEAVFFDNLNSNLFGQRGG